MCVRKQRLCVCMRTPFFALCRSVFDCSKNEDGALILDADPSITCGDVSGVFSGFRDQRSLGTRVSFSHVPRGVALLTNRAHYVIGP